MSAPILSARGLCKSFGGLRAVHEADLDLRQGEVRALIGPNGAGKTTLVSMLIGRLMPDAGRILLDGADITRLAPERRVQRGMAYCFQITSVFQRLTVEENVALAARRRLGRDRAAVAGEVARALGEVGLGDRAGHVAGDLAYGHQRLLEIAMGLAQRPRVIILDEPTQGLAEAEIAGFRRLVREIAGETTVLLIEHNMDVVMALADRVTVLNFGAVLAEGTPAEIHADPAVQAAYLGAA
jgi:branched-chain amino acid transport system ATP-binding protein